MLHQFGSPGVLRAESVADPATRDGWALVELRAAALNWHDCLVRQGLYEIPVPRVLGADAPASAATPARRS